jgi:hypothetical protein
VALLCIDAPEDLAPLIAEVVSHALFSLTTSRFKAGPHLALEGRQARPIQNLDRIGTEFVEKAVVVAVHP